MSAIRNWGKHILSPLQLYSVGKREGIVQSKTASDSSGGTAPVSTAVACRSIHLPTTGGICCVERIPDGKTFFLDMTARRKLLARGMASWSGLPCTCGRLHFRIGHRDDFY